MKRFHVRWQEKTHVVTVHNAQSQDAYAIAIDDQPQSLCHARMLEGGGFLWAQDHKTHIVRIDDTHPDMWIVNVDGAEYRLSVSDIMRPGLHGKKNNNEGQSEQARVLSPMPGKVLRLMVGVGDKVELGQSLLVIEAMKMENELQSRISGEIKNIHVQIGDAVSSGALLIEIA